MSITEIEAMSREEQLLSIELLWDGICHQTPASAPASPDWHRTELEARQKRVNEGSAKSLTLDELKQRLAP